MDLLAILFWILFLLLFYTYVGYGIIASLFGLFRKKTKTLKGDYLPPVTIVIPEYNEAGIMFSKLENTIGLNYPKDKLKIIVVSDGSTDNSDQVLNTYADITWVRQNRRMGKAAALNRAMSLVDTPFVIFSDANTYLNKDSVRNLVAHFRDKKIGAVAGEKKVLHNSGVGTAEGWYWRYESYMKKADAAFYTVVGATGELFAMRTSLYKHIPEWIILDDLYLSLKICLQNYSIAYEPAAYATEAPSTSLADEKRRKRRISAGAFQLLSLIPLSKTFNIPILGFQFLSRRYLRWVFSPVIVPLLLVLNISLTIFHPAPVYDWLLMLQGLFYIAASIGWQMARINTTFSLFTIPFYFLFMNYCMISGWSRYRNDQETVLWRKAERTLV